MIRKHIDDLELEVLLVGSDYQAAEKAKLLKRAMVSYLDPEWNRPHRKRMERIRAGVAV
jgi:hypothetical protein